MTAHSASTSLVLDALLKRSSTDALVGPVPQGDVLYRILSAGLRAPDHGKLRPWRYVVISGEAREALAQEVHAAIERQEPDLPAAKKEKRVGRFRSMPMIIGLGMHLHPDHKIPLEEQHMSVAAGAMNVLNALSLEGFGGVWVSGPFCEDREFLQHLGLETPHRLAGFLFVGTPQHPDHVTRRPDIEDYMAIWQGAGSASFAADRSKN
ncbi:nitroreductase [Saccharibacter sp. 17.LH.SD]|uniref:nitroreductase family protein n=1 Tax=Saccharibacter sp. 17.LH.SD TaxID=2689393 RepID=UPI001371C505|nr:nitroreductase [Saccharibacter sp. 17.LH.SD]MXV44936.1 nitroreductase [Saccharibacter sp. 17.LH.SD]